MLPHWESPASLETISGSFMAFLRKSSVTGEPNLSQNSCGDSASSLRSKLQHLQPTTHRQTGRLNVSTRKLNNSSDSSLINDRMTGMNGSLLLSLPTMTRFMPRHNPPHSCLMLASLGQNPQLGFEP